VKKGPSGEPTLREPLGFGQLEIPASR
jgi:hypothetical protein